MRRGVRDDPRRSGPLARYLASAVLVRTADEGARVSLVLLALDRTGSAAIGGTLIAALLVPHVVAAPLVGALVDRARRPGPVLASAVLVFAVSLVAVALTLGRAPLWVSHLVLVLGGCCGPAVTGGLTSQLPALVGPARTPRAFGLDSLFYNVAGVTGPAVAGVAAAAAGPTAAQVLLGLGAALGALGIAALPVAPASEPARATRTDLLGGARQILRQPTLRVVTLTSTLGQVGPGALAVVAALLAASLGRPASSGVLLSAVAAGSCVGSLVWTWRPLAADRAPLVTSLSMVGIGLPLAVSALTPSLVATAALFAVSGVFVGPFGSALFTARTRLSDPSTRTQVFTIGAGLKTTAAALGAGLIGFATALPVPAQLLLVASSPVCAGLVGALLLTRRSRTEPERLPAPAARASG